MASKLRCRILCRAAGLAMLLAFWPALPAALAQPVQNDGITVTGVGIVQVKPSVVEITGVVSADAELASDARVKYLDARKKAIDAVQAMNEPGLTVKPSGPVIGQAIDSAAQMRMMQGQMSDSNPKQRVKITEKIMLELCGADKMEADKLIEKVLKIIDVARDAGMGVGPQTPHNYYEYQWYMNNQNGEERDRIATFKIPDRSGFESDAYEQAVKDARAKAQRIADLSGVKLGRVLEVVDQSSLPRAAEGPSALPVDRSMTANRLEDISITVKLQVRFEILTK